MYVPEKRKRRIVIAAIVAAILIPVSVAAFFIVRDWRSRASPTEKPQEVRISDLTQSSLVVSWITPETATEGWIQYSEQSGVEQGSPIAQDDRDVRSGTIEGRTTHYVTISNLEPGTKYYFIIGSGSDTYKDENGAEFEFVTADFTDDSIPTPDPVYGSVSNGQNQGAIVYVTLSEGSDKSFPVSALTNDSGNFEIDLSHIRTATLESKFNYTDETEMTIFAQGGDIGGAVLNIPVGYDDEIAMTMDADYTITDIFADSSGLDVGDSDGDGDTPDDEPDDTPDEEPEEPEEDPEEPERQEFSVVHDVPLERLVLGDTTGPSWTGIREIHITNVTENSFSVVWESQESESGYVSYGATEDLAEAASDDRDATVGSGSYHMHHVSVSDLIPETTYFFIINSGEEVYDDEGTSYQVTLPAIQDSPPEFDSVLGEISGTGSSDTAVIGKIVSGEGTSAEISSIADSDGKWTLSIGGVRTSDYSEYFTYTSDDSLTVMAITRGNSETSTYNLADVGEDVITIELDMIEDTGDGGDGDEDFDRGLVDSIDEIADNLDNLPQTAVNRIAAVSLTIALLMIGYGSYLLFSLYRSEKMSRWESEVVRDLGI